jgi:SMC interacting uncharacterized protein involved in chromosome segregation
MTEEGSAGKVEERIAALKKLKEELAQQVRDLDVENPRVEEVRRLLTEYDLYDRELLRMEKVLRKLKG